MEIKVDFTDLLDLLDELIENKVEEHLGAYDDCNCEEDEDTYEEDELDDTYAQGYLDGYKAGIENLIALTNCEAVKMFKDDNKVKLDEESYEKSRWLKDLLDDIKNSAK